MYQQIPSCPPPTYTVTTNNNLNTNEEKFRSIVQKYEISKMFVNKLQSLQTFKIVFIFDDSGSMNTALQDSPLNKTNNLIKATRWDELLYFANISIEIASIFNTKGCDIYFLNRSPPVHNVKDTSELVNYFANTPNGYTPLTEVLKQVLNDNPESSLAERKLLIIIVTDGEPTNHDGVKDVKGFKMCLKSRSNNVFTNIIACTDDEQSMAYLNNWDRKLKNLDVIDDFRSERTEVMKARGPNFQFSFGDYVVKSLVGATDEEMDNLDEPDGVSCCTPL